MEIEDHCVLIAAPELLSTEPWPLCVVGTNPSTSWLYRMDIHSFLLDDF